MTTARLVAKERQLDWLLGEVIGGVRAAGPRLAAAGSTSMHRQRWIAAALLTLAVGTAVGVALLRLDESAPRAAQQPVEDAPWHEAHGPASTATIPADVHSLRCFDFDDAAVAQLARLTKLERLDLSGMDVDARGVSRSLPITDAGITSLGALHNLRWLSLSGCHQIDGSGLQALEALPRLEYLDLTFTGIESAAVERLQRLPGLRELSLAHCMNFHGRSLAAVANIAGLRRLVLQGCTTLSADDVAHLAKLHELRHLDLRDCQGRFRGQTARAMTADGKEPPPPPVQDGIGITDATVQAIGGLPLTTLLLGGSESLTDAIGDTLAPMTSLRSLDLSHLPKTTGPILEKLPPNLESLFLHGSAQLFLHLHQQAPLPHLRELSLPVDEGLTDAHLEALLAPHHLHTLRLVDVSRHTLRDIVPSQHSRLTGAAGAFVAQQRGLRRLAVHNAPWLDDRFLQAVAQLPELTELDLTSCTVGTAVRHLAPATNLRSLKLMWCTGLDPAGLRALAAVPLRELDLYGTKLAPDAVREVGKAWPGCRIKMPNGQTWRVPGRQ